MTTAVGTNWATDRATNRGDSQLSRAGASLGRRLGRSLGSGLKAVQYAQMIAVMNRLPDDYLDRAGLRRADIPAHARRAIYGEEIARRR